jgi:hypothetical protein
MKNGEPGNGLPVFVCTVATICLLFLLSTLLLGCGEGGASPIPASNSNREVNPTEASLPDRITCKQESSEYQLVLVIKDRALPGGITAVGLKKNSEVVFKILTQTYADTSNPNIINFIETPATLNSREVELNFSNKSATLLNAQIFELGESPVFGCQF